MARETETPFPATNPFASRTLSAFEFLFGAFIVIGHNVFHIIPNELIVLCALGLVSVRVRDGHWSAIGFTRPDIGRRSTIAYWLGIMLVSVLFGYGHYYKGPSGIIDSAIAGLLLGIAYIVAGRNLWACVLTHGFIDTFGVIGAFFGWSK
jgi:Type II CAAX prenyl endopeptidase Rce1-like